MTAGNLRNLDVNELSAYLWRRLRRESGVNPPMADRWGTEAPEQFVLQAGKEKYDEDFPKFFLRLEAAALMHLEHFRFMQVIGHLEPPWDDTDDEHIASLAFMAAQMKSHMMYLKACGLASRIVDMGPEGVVSSGQVHLLRTIVLYFSEYDNDLADFWKNLWHNGPRSIRGIVIHGWSRGDKDALEHLGELVDATEFGLSTMIWNLMRSQTGPGEQAVLDAAKHLAAEQQVKFRKAMTDSGIVPLI